MQDDYIEPEQLLKIANDEMKQIPKEALFNSPTQNTKKLLEKWTAGQFGVCYGRYVHKCTVRLSKSQRDSADFSLKTNNQEWPFQLTECNVPARKRGKEYKKMAEGKDKTMPMKIGGKIESIEWIKQAIEKKANKNYVDSAKLNLLIYENFSFSAIEYEELKFMARKYIGKFASIWILSNSKICSLFSSQELGGVPGWKKLVPP